MKLNKIFPIVALLLFSLGLIGGILTSAGIQREVNLQEGLVAYWSFDEGEGDMAFDEMDKYRVVAFICIQNKCSSLQWVEGKVGFAIQLDGKHYGEITDGSELKMTKSNFSVGAWINIGKEASTGHMAFVTGPGVLGQKSNDLRAKYGLGTQTGGWQETMGPVLERGTWLHMTLVRDGSSLKGYLNGKLVTRLEIAGDNVVAAVPAIGAAYYDRAWRQLFKGVIDEVRIYNRALTEPEITILVKMET